MVKPTQQPPPGKRVQSSNAIEAKAAAQAKEEARNSAKKEQLQNLMNVTKLETKDTPLKYSHVKSGTSRAAASKDKPPGAAAPDAVIDLEKPNTCSSPPSAVSTPPTSLLDDDTADSPAESPVTDPVLGGAAGSPAESPAVDPVTAEQARVKARGPDVPRAAHPQTPPWFAGTKPNGRKKPKLRRQNALDGGDTHQYPNTTATTTSGVQRQAGIATATLTGTKRATGKPRSDTARQPPDGRGKPVVQEETKGRADQQTDAGKESYEVLSSANRKTLRKKFSVAHRLKEQARLLAPGLPGAPRMLLDYMNERSSPPTRPAGLMPPQSRPDGSSPSRTSSYGSSPSITSSDWLSPRRSRADDEHNQHGDSQVVECGVDTLVQDLLDVPADREHVHIATDADREHVHIATDADPNVPGYAGCTDTDQEIPRTQDEETLPVEPVAQIVAEYLGSTSSRVSVDSAEHERLPGFGWQSLSPRTVSAPEVYHPTQSFTPLGQRDVQSALEYVHRDSSDEFEDFQGGYDAESMVSSTRTPLSSMPLQEVSLPPTPYSAQVQQQQQDIEESTATPTSQLIGEGLASQHVAPSPHDAMPPVTPHAAHTPRLHTPQATPTPYSTPGSTPRAASRNT